MQSIIPLKFNKIYVILFCSYLFIIAIYGSDRILHRNEYVKFVIEKDGSEGYGYQYVNYFNKINVIKPIEPFVLRDFLTSMCLFVAAATTFSVYALLRKIPYKTKDRFFYAILSFSFLYLGLDELFQIHEFLGLNLAHILYPGLSIDNLSEKDFNGLIVVFYAIAAIVVFISKWRFFRFAPALWVLLAGLSLQAFASIIDYYHDKLHMFKNILGTLEFLIYRDEFFEMSAAFMYMSALIIYSVNSISKYYRYENANYLLKSDLVNTNYVSNKKRDSLITKEEETSTIREGASV